MISLFGLACSSLLLGTVIGILRNKILEPSKKTICAAFLLMIMLLCFINLIGSLNQLYSYTTEERVRNEASQ